MDEDVSIHSSGARWKFGFDARGAVPIFCHTRHSKRNKEAPRSSIHDPCKPSSGRFVYNKHTDTAAEISMVDENDVNSLIDNCLALRAPQPENIVRTEEGSMIFES
jgi:hypothetical protein